MDEMRFLSNVYIRGESWGDYFAVSFPSQNGVKILIAITLEQFVECVQP